jgi:N-carbamoylputrescine amidase
MPFTVGCAQFAPEKAKLEKNLDRIADFILQASAEGADLVVFPETATSAYFLEGGVAESALSGQELSQELGRRLKNLTRPVDSLIGFYESHEGDLHNSAAYVEFLPAPKLVHVYRKFFLPTYGVFDEERFVGRGTDLGVFDTRFCRMAVLICEDVWHSILPTLAAVRGARVILVPSASPARGFEGPGIGNHERYRRMLTAVSEEHGVFCVNVQLTGFEGGKGFLGGSMVVDPMGKVIAESPIQEEHLLLAEIDLDLVEVARTQLPLISDLRSAWQDIVRIAEDA